LFLHDALNLVQIFLQSSFERDKKLIQSKKSKVSKTNLDVSDLMYSKGISQKLFIIRSFHVFELSIMNLNYK